jgi:hypothetical protein
MRLPVLISVCLSLATTWLIAKNTEFTQSRNLPPLRLAAADLDTILLRAQSLITEANGPSGEQDSARESVKLGVRGHEIEIPHFSLASSVAFPREVFKFSYTYSRPNKPVSLVTLDFSDCSRQVSVTGDAADQVEAVSTFVEKNLLHYSTAIGGARFRHVAGVWLSLTFLTSLIVSAYWWNTRTYSALGMLVCSGLGLVLLLLVPWHRYLAGFALYQSYSPFLLIRYAPQISFFSLVAALSSEFHCHIFFCDGKHNHPTQITSLLLSRPFAKRSRD